MLMVFLEKNGNLQYEEEHQEDDREFRDKATV